MQAHTQMSLLHFCTSDADATHELQAAYNACEFTAYTHKHTLDTRVCALSVQMDTHLCVFSLSKCLNSVIGGRQQQQQQHPAPDPTCQNATTAAAAADAALLH